MQLEELLVDADCTVLQAMGRLDAAGRRILFIAPGGKLEAVLTDSDTRRFILRGGDLNSPVADAANHSPRWLPVERRGEARAFMQQHVIHAVPLLDKNGYIADVVFANELEGVAPPRRLHLPVVIMAGGLGTRLYPYTKILPKPLIPIGEVPIIEMVIQNFTDVGCDDFTLIVNYRKNMIKSYFGELEVPYNLHWADEDQPLGTGGGLSLLKGQISETFFLTNCDNLIEADYADIVAMHREKGNVVTMVCAMKQFTIPYGVVELDADGCLAGVAEKPQMNYLINAGMYVVEPEVLDMVPSGVSIGFPDIIERCRQAGGRVGVYPIGEAGWMDMGQMEELEEIRRRFGQG